MPTKRERCRSEVEAARGNRVELEVFLKQHSGLPGRRANIELAAAVADTFGSVSPSREERQMLTDWASVEVGAAPVNSREEFLPFCAVQIDEALNDVASHL